MKFNSFTEAFNRITINQMITLVQLLEHPYESEVASIRGKKLSAISKQISTMNKTFRDICGEDLVNSNNGKGKPVIFTSTGEIVAQQFAQFLNSTDKELDVKRNNVGKIITVASTSGMLSVLSGLWPEWQKTSRTHFQLGVEQIRTYEVIEYLNSYKADLVFAGRINHEDALKAYSQFDYCEWGPSSIVSILSNHTNMPNDVISISDIEEGRIKLILPRRGIINDFIQLVFHGRVQRINTVAYMDDLDFGLGLLTKKIYEASMLIIDPLGDRIIEDQKKINGITLHKYQIMGIEDYQISSGVFRRKGNYRVGHPMNTCWKIIEKNKP